jgi:hypothetical protein
MVARKPGDPVAAAARTQRSSHGSCTA